MSVTAAERGFARVAVLGTGLIGGSFGLALRRAQLTARIFGWDKPDVLAKAKSLGAIHEAAESAAAAIKGADLVYVALPVGASLEILPQIAEHASAQALVTDACGTKTAICRAGRDLFTAGARFLGGHPIAGKELSGIEHAEGGLFQGAAYALIGKPDHPDPRVRRFAALVGELGAETVWCEAEAHDHAVGIVSHLPQLVAVALARVVLDATDETGLAVALAGRGLRDLLRIAGSPYSVWRDICLTNTDNISDALDRLSQALDHIRASLRSRALDEEFQSANELYKILRKLQ